MRSNKSASTAELIEARRLILRSRQSAPRPVVAPRNLALLASGRTPGSPTEPGGPAQWGDTEWAETMIDPRS